MLSFTGMTSLVFITGMPGISHYSAFFNNKQKSKDFKDTRKHGALSLGRVRKGG